MRNRLGVLLAAGVTFGSVLMGAAGGVAAAAPAPAAAPTGAVVTPLDHGWVATIVDQFQFVDPTSIPSPTLDSGTTAAGGATASNVLTGSMTGKHGTYQVQVALPVGDTFLMGRNYSSFGDSASVHVSWPGGGCAGDSGSGEASFTVNQLARSVGGAATTYAVQFLCYSPVALVEGAIAFNIVPTTVGQGYYTYGWDGSINGSGNDDYLNYLGSLAGTSLNQPIVGMSTTSDGRGYWLVAADGGLFAFGDAKFHGSMGGKPLNEPIVGMTSSPGGGYRMVASDGGIFAFGGAPFYGSMGGTALNQPIVGMTGTSDGKGYWMVATDGGIFAFGDAGYHGSTAAIPLNEPIVGMAATTDDGGYWLVGGDGGVFAFGDAPYFGSLGYFNFPNVAGIAT